MTKQFVFDAHLQQDDIANQREVIATLCTSVEGGRRIVFFGKRNMAKTSIVKNVIAPHFLKIHKRAVIVYCELMGLKNFDDLDERFTKSFNDAMSGIFKLKAMIESTKRLLKGLRPTYELTDSGHFEFSIRTDRGSFVVPFEKLIEKIREIHKQVPCLLIFDEFQDVHFVSTLEAKVRRLFEELPANLPIIVLGSKQHMLLEIFQRHKAPFYNWGEQVPITNIDPSEYNFYIRDRLIPQLTGTSDEVLMYLQEKLFHCPEDVNRICHKANIFLNRPLQKSDVDLLIEKHTQGVSEAMELRMFHLTKHQIDFLREIASTDGFLKHPTQRKVRESMRVSATAIQKIVRTLLDQGLVDLNPDRSITISDPFLYYHLRRTRIITR